MSESLFERHRVELTAFCYRMLGSGFEAEDAVQETLMRAWRAYDRFDPDKGSARTWLYAIATNVCFDLLRGAQRRAGAMELAASARPGDPLGAPLPEQYWVHPVPTDRVLAGDPAELVVQRESVRLAFIAALQLLPARQRAVLVLREVLHWRAAEVAALLKTSVASVNSALQRARATLAEHRDAEPRGFRAGSLDADDQVLLDRYVKAFERHDVETMTALLADDVVMSMPPFAWWLRGKADVRTVLLTPDSPCEGDRLVPTSANGLPAFGQYRDGKPFALLLLEPDGGRIGATTSYLEASRLFRLFGLPTSLATRRSA
ncbi:RNA polymerase subunit sigma-70 [Prauserella marina]|uniref:RNA polymerase sigma-70 factor, ECF subfamily n=1 Tax=Prauserella marina TaxID=530584 RepID=A0A222VXE1_9PSEU|nr:sigma-70 family RNA polymerase sigma factor [Prauserella marina]ASR38584.1 RNA polymerase subunit sigma-70 [Prauserella marina]PWV81903.1 RNA polymerase sigma-70 factor (ECF subfamily) [Prauserella marina]SDD14990.1 RNA polymerase sigma-70 factor, ECF subfamily [Prauserella marina]